jgi:hypothetical protein
MEQHVSYFVYTIYTNRPCCSLSVKDSRSFVVLSILQRFEIEVPTPVPQHPQDPPALLHWQAHVHKPLRESNRHTSRADAKLHSQATGLTLTTIIMPVEYSLASAMTCKARTPPFKTRAQMQLLIAREAEIEKSWKPKSVWHRIGRVVFGLLASVRQRSMFH